MVHLHDNSQRFTFTRYNTIESSNPFTQQYTLIIYIITLENY